MKNQLTILKKGICLIALGLAVSCSNKGDKSEEKEPDPEQAKTPVTVTQVQVTTLHDSIELNATSVFLQSNYVKSTTNGYVQAVNAIPGEYVSEGKELFTIVTKESLVIGNSISSLDTSFKFNGVNKIKSTTHGYITQLNHQVGDYVQDGEQLAVISEAGSFAFLLNLPYELRPYVLNKKTVELSLPDGVRLQGHIASVMPTVDSASQTQPVVIKVDSKVHIPQNLIAKVHIIKDVKDHAQILPKSAILSNEAQTSFWVMKMIDSVTAVKTEIQKGIELNNKVEILKPVFSASDLILVTGNYGLPDTAKVMIEK
jgi:multidrug efflux pump subunit AcrA (membrane-fusion protein)